MEPTLRARWPMLAGLLALAAAGLILLSTWSAELARYRQFVSPDGRYQLVVLREKPLLAMRPGQSSDAPGRVRLLDAEGRLLREASVEMVQVIDEAQWSNDRVVVPLILDWPLPAAATPAPGAAR